MKERTEKIIAEFFEKNSDLLAIKSSILKALDMLLSTVMQDGTIYVCGNGGSSSDSQHIAGELLKSFVLKRKVSQDLESKLTSRWQEDGKAIANNLQQGIKCIPLDSFSSFQTAYANDCDGDYAFTQLLSVLAKKSDSLISISTSGNSRNCLLACKLAKTLGLNVILLTGKLGGKIKDVADISICTPSTVCYTIQEYHIKIYHLLCLCLESEKFLE